MKHVHTVKISGKTRKLSVGEKLDLNAGLYELSVEAPGYYWNSKVEVQEYFNCDFVYDADAGQMEFHARLLERPEILEAIKAGKLLLRGEIRDPAGKPVASGETRIDRCRGVLKVDFADPATATYSLRASVTGFPSRMEVRKPFTVPDRSFLGNRRGITDKVPAP